MRNTFHQEIRPGEAFGYDVYGGGTPTTPATHALVYLGDDKNQEGFYFLSYDGGKLDNSFRSDRIVVGYATYHQMYQIVRSGTIYFNNMKPMITGRLECPVDATIELNGETLNSTGLENGEECISSFGTMTRLGEAIDFTIDYRTDYHFEIWGTGNGTMNVFLQYDMETETTTRTFIDVPITNTTKIATSPFDSSGPFSLYVNTDQSDVSTWSANVNATSSKAENSASDTSSSNSGNSSGANSIVISNVTGGKISLSSANAAKGTTVTINLTPDKGYQTGAVTVKDAKGNTVEVKRVSDNRYTFVMPDSKVTVAATFEKTEVAPPTPSTGFSDVSSGDYFADAVKWAVEKGITTGTSATQFSPNASCTRAQMMAFLWRAAGSPAVAGENPFTDVSASSYYYDAVRWAVSQGITQGTSATTFGPGETVTRGQTVAFLYRYAGSPAAGSGSAFADVASGAYYSDAVQWAVNKGITNGVSSTAFGPADDCTRGQIVTFLYRYAG